MTARTIGLESLLAGEHAAVNGYGEAGAVLVRLAAPVPVIAAARGGFDAHRESRDRLSDAIATAGGTPPGALPAYALPFPVTSAAAALRLLTVLEDQLCGVAAAAMSTVPAGGDRLLAADVLTAAAVRAARLRLLSGLPPGQAVIALPGLAGHG